MKLRELLEDVTGPGVTTAPFLKDGPLKVAKHFVDRLRQRDLDLKTVSRFISRAIKKNKAEIEALPVDTSFILKSRFGLGVAVVKQETPDGIVYLINTAHPEFSVGPDQEVFLGDDSKLLDKPTLTVGELAEKYKTSLLAVEQQLKKGIKVEMEHTKKMSVAKEIALDHLAEDLYYYKKLAKIEKTNEGQFRSKDVEEWKPSKEQLSDLKSKYLPDWEMLDHRILEAHYTAKDHRHADKFTEIINKISEEMDHFCEVTQDVAEVSVKTTTSDVKGLTLLDFEIAMRIDAVAEKMDIEQIRSKGNFDENFADGRNPQDKGDSRRHGIPKGATIAQLKKIRSSDSASPRKKQLAHWQINMRQGKKKGS